MQMLEAVMKNEMRTIESAKTVIQIFVFKIQVQNTLRKQVSSFQNNA